MSAGLAGIALLAIVFGLLVLRQNVILTVAVATAFVHVAMARKSAVEFLIQDMWFAIDREVLLSIPMFLLSGAVMTRGAIASRLIDIMTVLTRPVPGGLGLSCILSCAAFAAISGSSVVTMLAVGTLMYPALIKAGEPVSSPGRRVGFRCALPDLRVVHAGPIRGRRTSCSRSPPSSPRGNRW